MPPRRRKEDDYPAKHRAGAGMPTPYVDPDAPGSSSTRRRRPQHGQTPQPRPKPPAAPKAPQHDPDSRRTRRERRDDVLRDYSYRQAARGGGPPSVAGRTAAGAAAGAAAGSAIAPGVGTVAGGVIGGTGGALAGRAAKKAYKLARHASPGARKLIVAEFMLCMIIAALSPLTDRKRDETPAAMMKRLTAIMAAFLFLGLLSAAGRGASRFAAGFGGLITIALAASNRDLFVKIGNLFGAQPIGSAMGEAGSPADDNAAQLAGGAAGGILGGVTGP